jgi:hypothetical protein
MLNRLAVVVVPKQPLVDWVRFNDPADPFITLDEAREDATVYLLPEVEGEAEYRDILAEIWDSIFEQELAMWYTDVDLWPHGRTLEMFWQWFDCKFHSGIVDLTDAPLEDDGL